MTLPYDRILRKRKIANKSDMEWSWSLNTPCKSFKGILVLFESQESFPQNTSMFYDPKTEKVSVIVKGSSSQLYAQGMRSFKQYDEICKYFAEGKPKDANANKVQKHVSVIALKMRE